MNIDRFLIILFLSMGVLSVKAETKNQSDMSIFNFIKGTTDNYLGLSLYSDKEMEIVESYISDNFGKFDDVFHEFASSVIHVDICIIPPTQEHNYLTLVTMGMGAKKMNVPFGLRDQPRTRAELLICLPPDWPLSEDSLKEGKWYWPIRLLSKLARLPFDENSWIGEGHTIEYGECFDESTQLCGAILVTPQIQNFKPCFLTKRKVVNFFQVIPLYKDEIDFKQRHNDEELLKFFSKDDMIIDPNRNSALDKEQ